MKGYLLPLAVLLASYLVLFAIVGLTYRSLPARVASHFNGAGQPNGWLSRKSAVEFVVVPAFLVPVLMIGIMLLCSRMPVQYINLPNRDYWAAPDGRARLKRTLVGWALWFSSMMVLFLAGVHGLVVVANLTGGSQLSMNGLAALVICFVVGTLVSSLVLLLRLLRPN